MCAQMYGVVCVRVFENMLVEWMLCVCVCVCTYAWSMYVLCMWSMFVRTCGMCGCEWIWYACILRTTNVLIYACKHICMSITCMYMTVNDGRWTEAFVSAMHSQAITLKHILAEMRQRCPEAKLALLVSNAYATSHIHNGSCTHVHTNMFGRKCKHKLTSPPLVLPRPQTPQQAWPLVRESSRALWQQANSHMSVEWFAKWDERKVPEKRCSTSKNFIKHFHAFWKALCTYCLTQKYLSLFMHMTISICVFLGTVDVACIQERRVDFLNVCTWYSPTTALWKSELADLKEPAPR